MFECPKSIKNMKKMMLGASDTWYMSRLSHRPSDQAYYIKDCRICSLSCWGPQHVITIVHKLHQQKLYQLVHSTTNQYH